MWEVAGMTFVAKPTTGCCRTYRLNLMSWGKMHLSTGAESRWRSPALLALHPSAEIGTIHPLHGLGDVNLFDLSQGRSRVPTDSFVLSGPLRESVLWNVTWQTQTCCVSTICQTSLHQISLLGFFFFFNGYIADVSAYAERPQKGSVRSWGVFFYLAQPQSIPDLILIWTRTIFFKGKKILILSRFASGRKLITANPWWA